MRVTRIIRDYIVDEVNKRIPVTNLPEYQELESRYNAARDCFIDSLDNAIDNIITATNIKYDLPEGWKIKRSSLTKGTYRIIDTFPEDGGELYKLNRQHRAAIDHKREDVINNILITLELGGTKAELEEMLNKVGKDEEA